MNLKLPVAANAMNLTKKQPNTPEVRPLLGGCCGLLPDDRCHPDAGSGVRLLHQPGIRAARRQDGLRLPAAGPVRLHGAGLFASSSSGSKVVKGGIKGVLPVLIIMTVVSLAARLAGYGSVLGGLVGIFIIVMLPIGILTSYVLWKKGKIQVVDKEQK